MPHKCPAPLTRRICPLLPCMQDGRAALIVTAMCGDIDIAELLLMRGAQVNHQSNVVRGEGAMGTFVGARRLRIGLCF